MARAYKPWSFRKVRKTNQSQGLQEVLPRVKLQSGGETMEGSRMGPPNPLIRGKPLQLTVLIHDRTNMDFGLWKN